MKARLALIVAALLAGCHRPRADQPSPGADSDAQAATANKTLADLKAADEAAQGPAPEIAPVVHQDAPPPRPTHAETTPADEPGDASANEGDPPTP